MFKRNKPKPAVIPGITAQEGETIEIQVARIMQNKEPIKDVVPMIYTERKDGVLPQYDIRTDKMEVALMATDTASRVNLAKRENNLKKVKGGQSQENNSGGSESTQGTGGEGANPTNSK